MERSLSMSLAGVLLILLSGCASQSCDPRYDSGFFGTIGCHVGGAYKDRQATLDEHLSAEQRTGAELKTQVIETKATQAEVADQLAALEKELASMDERLRKVQAQLAKRRHTTVPLQQQIAETRSRIQRVQHSSQPESEKIKQRDALKKRVEELEKEAAAVE